MGVGAPLPKTVAQLLRLAGRHRGLWSLPERGTHPQPHLRYEL